MVGIKHRKTKQVFVAPMTYVTQESEGKLVSDSVNGGAPAYKDESKAYTKLENHKAVNLSICCDSAGASSGSPHVGSSVEYKSP